jgi:hypothetical protein
MPSELGLVSDIEADGKIEESDMEAVINFYKDTFLTSKLAMLNNVIEADEEAAKDYRQLKFTEGVINGRIAVIESEEEAAKRTKAKKVANKAIVQMNKAEKAVQKAEFTSFVKNVSKKSRKR